jgi:hypothetical protein
MRPSYLISLDSAHIELLLELLASRIRENGHTHPNVSIEHNTYLALQLQYVAD